MKSGNKRKYLFIVCTFTHEVIPFVRTVTLKFVHPYLLVISRHSLFKRDFFNVKYHDFFN